MIEAHFEIDDTALYRRLCGQGDANIRKIEKYFSVTMIPRGNTLTVRGEKKHADQVIEMLHLASDVLREREASYELDDFDIRYMAESIISGEKLRPDDIKKLKITIRDSGKTVVPRTANQARYISAIHKSALTFGVGPAGTGKTYLAVACGLYYLQAGKVEKIVLTRPAVEAGENLGYLPGDLIQKINPYLRPLYDALFDLMSFEKITRLMEKGSIEIAPLAYMRGRTLNNSFIILDEAQNTLMSQMKMFLTRLGNNSKIVISGDVTQIDLEKPKSSGLLHAMKILRHIEDIQFIRFGREDITRHPLVEKIVAAYEQTIQAE